MDSKTIVDYLFSLYDKLSWQRLGQVAIVLVMVAAGVLFYKNIDYLSGAIRPSKLSAERQDLIVSDAGKNAIEDVLKKTGNNISAIFVTSANVERNTRKIIFFRTTDPEIQRQRTEFENTHATVDVPLFSDNAESNRRIIAYINGEFVCSEFKSTEAARYLFNTDIKTVCATAVPPIYGKFRGTVVALIRSVPDADETTRLKILLRDLSDKLDNPSSSAQ